MTTIISLLFTRSQFIYFYYWICALWPTLSCLSLLRNKLALFIKLLSIAYHTLCKIRCWVGGRKELTMKCHRSGVLRHCASFYGDGFHTSVKVTTTQPLVCFGGREILLHKTDCFLALEYWVLGISVLTLTCIRWQVEVKGTAFRGSILCCRVKCLVVKDQLVYLWSGPGMGLFLHILIIYFKTFLYKLFLYKEKLVWLWAVMILSLKLLYVYSVWYNCIIHNYKYENYQKNYCQGSATNDACITNYACSLLVSLDTK